MDKKRLLLIVPSLKQGGFQRVCARTAMLLNDSFEVSVLIFDGSERAYPLDGIGVFDIGVGAQNGVVNKFINVVKRIAKVKKIKKENQIDISYSFGMSANLINVLTKVKDEIWCGMRSYIDLETRTLGFVCKKTDLVITCSKVLEGYINEKYPMVKTVTVYNPFDVEAMGAEAKEDIEACNRDFLEAEGPVITAMGREDKLKGYWHLIKAFAKVNVTKARLCIIGSGKFEKEKQLVKELGIEENVLFTGGKTNPFSYLKYADVFVMSSVHEGFPNALVEAMALGIPVISTNCETGPAEILAREFKEVKDIKTVHYAEYGMLVPVMNNNPNYDSKHFEPEELILAEAISQMVTKDELKMKYEEAAKIRVKEFGTEEYIDSFVKLSGQLDF